MEKSDRKCTIKKECWTENRSNFIPLGQLKNVTWYRNGYPGTGTKQFTEDGKPLEPGVTFTVEEINQLA